MQSESCGAFTPFVKGDLVLCCPKNDTTPKNPKKGYCLAVNVMVTVPKSVWGFVICMPGSCHAGFNSIDKCC